VFHDVGKTRSLFARDPIYSVIEFWLLMKIIDNCPDFKSEESIFPEENYKF